jgi:hypothetical protein
LNWTRSPGEKSDEVDFQDDKLDLIIEISDKIPKCIKPDLGLSLAFSSIASPR